MFGHFADYLAARPDLFTAQDLHGFGGALAAPKPLPAETLRRVVESELGDRSADVADVAEEPFGVSHLWQVHRARSAVTGEAVLVRVRRPAVDRALLVDVDGLQQIAEYAILGADREPVDLGAAIQGFLGVLNDDCDLREHDAGLRDLGRVAESVDVGEPFAELGTRRLSVVATGPFLALDENGTARDVAPAAFRLARAWLELAARSHHIWLEPTARCAVQRSNGRIVIVGGLCRRISADQGVALDRYLAAIGRRDPDPAHDFLERWSSADPSYDADAVRHVLRQATPFRDHGYAGEPLEPGLAEELYVQWRLARVGGLRPGDRLLAAYVGLARLQRTATSLAPGAAAFADALRRHRVERALAEVGALARPDTWRRTVARAVPEIVDLVQQADAPVRDRAPRRAATRSGTVRPLGWLMLVASVTIALLQWSRLPPLPAALRLSAGGLLVATAAWLWLRRGRDRGT